LAEGDLGTFFHKTAWKPDISQVEFRDDLDAAEFIAGLIRCSGVNGLAQYALSNIARGFGFSDPMLIALDGEKYQIKRISNGELLEELVMDDRKRNLLKYVSRQRVPVNRFDFSKGRLLSAAHSQYDHLYSFGCIVPLCSLERVSGFLLFNHPSNRKPLNPQNTAFFKQILIPLGLAVDVAVALHTKGKHDPETGLLLKNAFLDEFSQELRRTVNVNRPLSLCILQFQNLREIASKHGEEAAYELEVLAGNLLRNNTRSNDLVFRYDNSRFVIIFPETAKAVAEPVVARLKGSLEQLKPAWSLRVLSGISGYPSDGDNTRLLFMEAESDMR